MSGGEAAVEVRLPDALPLPGEVVLASWACRPGEPVVAGTPVATLASDMGTMTLAAPTDGVLRSVSVMPGMVVRPGDLLGEVTPGAVADEVRAVAVRAAVEAVIAQQERTQRVWVASLWSGALAFLAVLLAWGLTVLGR
ncbi:MAG: hypothetical protein H6732_14160 [Alphaproteobacteria bacterium]|nr:hypothetical protein [Alphaproteobacteria bacterium]